MWDDANLVEMPTAGPRYLEDIPQLRPAAPPVTGEKRMCSLSESDLYLSQALEAANAINCTPQVNPPVLTPLIEECYNDYLAALDRLINKKTFDFLFLLIKD